MDLARIGRVAGAVGALGAGGVVLAACARNTPDNAEKPTGDSKPVVERDGVTMAQIEEHDGVARKEDTDHVADRLLDTFDRNLDGAIDIRYETMFREYVQNHSSREIDRDARPIAKAADSAGNRDGKADRAELMGVLEEYATTDRWITGDKLVEFETRFGYSETPGSLAKLPGSGAETVGMTIWNQRGIRPGTALPAMPDMGDAADSRRTMTKLTPPELTDASVAPAAIAATLLSRFDGDKNGALDVAREVDVTIGTLGTSSGMADVRRYDAHDFVAAADAAGDGDGSASELELTNLAKTFDTERADDSIAGSELLTLGERFGVTREVETGDAVVAGNRLVAAEHVHSDHPVLMRDPDLPAPVFETVTGIMTPRGYVPSPRSGGSFYSGAPMNPDIAFGNNSLEMNNSNFRAGM